MTPTPDGGGKFRILWRVCGAVIWLAGPAAAHPHIFVDARAGFMFADDGRLTALRISWTYDDFTTLFLYDALNLDEDGDGVLSDADKEAIIQGETQWDADYKGDVYLEVAGQDHPLGRPEAAAVSLQEGRVEVSFSLPVSGSVNTAQTPVTLRLYDPAFYYAYTILPNSDPQILPPGCVAEIVPFAPDEADSALQEELAGLGREETPDQQNVGRLFADEVVLTCG